MAQIPPPWSIFCIVVGIPLALWPYRMAMIREIFDAIGRRSAGSVEPAEWSVTLTRLIGGAFLIIGIAGILGAVS